MSLSTAKGFTKLILKMDETSGNALDSSGNGYDFTDNNAVGTGTGLIDGARDFERNSNQDFSHADNADLSCSDTDITICLYANFESFVDGMGVCAKWTTAGQREFLIRAIAGNKIQAFFSNDGTANVNVTANTFGALSTATWYAIVWVHDSVNNEVRLYVNGTKDSTAHSAGVFDGTDTFYVGQDGGADRFDGLMDEFAFIKGYAFTDADATEHWNSGAGKAWATWDATSGGVSNIRRR